MVRSPMREQPIASSSKVQTDRDPTSMDFANLTTLWYT